MSETIITVKKYYEFKAPKGQVVTVFLRANNYPSPGKAYRCNNCGVVVGEYFGANVEAVFEGKFLGRNIFGMDIMCGRCKTIYRFMYMI